MATAVETRNLGMHFGGVAAVNRVSFKLKRGELRCLIGANGAGKSTFFKCLTGQLAPTEGEVFINGQNVTNWHPHEIARMGVGIKTQVPSVLDNLPVRENLWLAAYRTHGRSQAMREARNVIERLGLSGIAETDVGQLSHGDRQKVELGIVVVGRPWLILLDEPAAGMTGAEVAQMAGMIGELNQSASLIIVEHDMQFIRSIANIVTVFDRGRILAEDNVDAIMRNERVRDVYLGKRA